MKHLVLFDIDGTLLRARGAGKIAFEKAFGELFGIFDVWKSLNAHGRTDRDIIDELSEKQLGRLLLADEQQELEHRFITYFDKVLKDHPYFELMPGVEALLNALQERPDINVAIETGNLQQTANAKLIRGAIDHHFEVGGYGSDSRDRREIVKVAITRAKEAGLCEGNASITVIGDSVNDVIAAHANGARAIAVSTGGLSVEELQTQSKADLIQEDLLRSDQIIDFITE